MRVVVDARMLGHSGIGRYLTELLLCWGKDARVSELLALGPPEASWRQLAAPDNFHAVPYPAPIYSIREQVRGPWILARTRRAWDVVFFPHFNVPIWSPGPAVVTIHDLIHLRFPGFFAGGQRAALRIALYRIVRRARRIITDSATTRDDLLELFPGAEPRVRVASPGVSATFRILPREKLTTALKRLGQDRPYVVYVGNFKALKNLATLVRAFARLSVEYPQLQLLLVGRPFPEHETVRSLIRAENLTTRVRELIGMSDEDLVALLNGAAVAVQPSLYEGFGLPVVEAMACGTPVLVSNTPALLEVAGNAALCYGAPTNVDGLVEALRNVLADGELSNVMRERGHRRCRAFTWNAASNTIIETLAEAANMRRSGHA